MEQSDPTNRVTPYELATLAARICPERCMSDPEGAIAAAQRLLSEGKMALTKERMEERREEREDAEIRKHMTETREDWPRAIKDITCEARRDRAIKRFKQFLDYRYPGEAKERLSIYKRDGVTLQEI